MLEQSLAAVARGSSKSLANFLRADNAPDLLLRVSAAARSHPTWHGKRRLAAVARAVFRAAVAAREDSSDKNGTAGSSEGPPLSSSPSQGAGAGSSGAWEEDEALCRVALHAAANMLETTSTSNTACRIGSSWDSNCCSGNGGGASTVGCWPLPLGDVALDLLSGVVEHALQAAPVPGASGSGSSGCHNSGGTAAATFLGTHVVFLSEVLLQCLVRLHAAAEHQRIIRQAYRQRAAACGAGLSEDSLGNWSSIGAKTSSSTGKILRETCWNDQLCACVN